MPTSLPALPPLEAMHPLVVHLPLVLLMLTPFWWLLAILWPAHRASWAITGLICLWIGTAGAWAAEFTGHASVAAGVMEEATVRQSAETHQQLLSTFADHQNLATFTRNAFSVLTILTLLPLGLARINGKPLAGRQTALLVLGIVLWIPAGWLLIHAGHQGAQLVHTYGVTAGLGIR